MESRKIKSVTKKKKRISDAVQNFMDGALMYSRPTWRRLYDSMNRSRTTVIGDDSPQMFFSEA